MWEIYNRAMRSVDGLTSWEWFAVLIAVVLLGLVCMRGFGSRTDY
jgi:hypothetical protein